MHELPKPAPIREPPVIIDARGLLCPQPLVLARLALNSASCGQLLEVWITDPLAPLDLEALCARTGHRFRGQHERADGVLVVNIEKCSTAGDAHSNARMRSRI